MSEKKKKQAPYERISRYLGILGAQVFVNAEYWYYLIIGTLILIYRFDSPNPWAWGFAAISCVLFGLWGIAAAVRPIDRAFESLPIDFGTGYGSPLWIVEGRFPLKQDTIRINAAGYGEGAFEKHLETISSRLSQPIRSIRKPMSDKPIIEIAIKRTDIPRELLYGSLSPATLAQGEFFIGRSENALVKKNLSEIIHMLIGGQTGSGKTQFIKQLMATILAYTRNAHVCLIDMKEGIDFPQFEGLPNCEMALNYQDADRMLASLHALYELRKDILKARKKDHWKNLTASDLEKEKKLEGKPIGPVLVVVDELANLAREAGTKTQKATLQDRLAKLAQLARFTGIHLILGMQRPDKNVITGQSKDTIPTRMCFSVPSVTASTLVIGDMTASTIGMHPGRAVFQFTGNEIVQAPFLNNTELAAMMESVKEKLQKSNYKKSVLATSEPSRPQTSDKPEVQQ